MDKLTKNLGRKILSFIIALFCWIIIYNIYDPVITVYIDNIPVDILNEDSLSSIKKIYEITEGNYVDVYVKGKQSIVKGLKKSDLKATADLSKLSEVNAVRINVSLKDNKNNDIDITYGKVDTLVVSLDNYVTKSFKLEVKEVGEISSEYYLYSHNLNGVYIKISGPQEKINKIDKIYIEPEMKYLKPGFTSSLNIKLYDSFESQLSSLNLDFSNNIIEYKPVVYKVKEIPVKFNMTGESPYGYKYLKNSYTPKNIKITGPEDELKNIDVINITQSISSIKETITLEYDIHDYISSNVFILTENNVIKNTIYIEKLELKTYEFDLSEISIKNLPEKMSINFINKDKFKITIMGEKDIITNLKIENLGPYIDLMDLSLGKHSETIKIVDDDRFELISSSEIKFELKEETTIVNVVEPTPTEPNESNEVNENNNEIETEIKEEPEEAPEVPEEDKEEETTPSTEESIENKTEKSKKK